MIDREELASRLYVALFVHAEETANARGVYIPPKTDELAAFALAAAQTLASSSCRQFGHVYGGEGTMHEHECARCGGNVASLLEADRKRFILEKGRGAAYFPPRVLIGDVE